MDVAQLLEPVLTGGIKDTHFFNGRILTADDLRTMQTASRLHDAQLGRAIGPGVLYGFDVSHLSTDPATGRVVLRVTQGLAFNEVGEAVALGASVDLRLVIGVDQPIVEGAFTICQPPAPQFVNDGLYILTVMPAVGLEGRAPMTELGTEGLGSKCSSRNEVDAVKFGIVRVSLPDTPASGSLYELLAQALTQIESTPVAPGTEPLSNAGRSLARNAIAYLCYGSEEREAASRDVAGRIDLSRYGLLNSLADGKLLTKCEVPLAAILWRPSGIEFIDTWAARRPVVPPARRRAGEGWAMFRQFQRQIDELFTSGMTNSELAAIQARQRFRYLPPVGVVPSAAPGVRGFSDEAFFFGLPRRTPEHVDGALLDALLGASLLHEPIDLRDNELVWVYRIWQNAIAQHDSPPPQPYLIFSSAHVPYLGPARFDVARWDYGNYAGPYGV